MKVNLKRPLAFIDLETTGIDIATDKIVEISILKLFPNQNKELKTIRINPGIPIPQSASAVHGISNDDVKDEPEFKSVAKDLATFLEGCDLAGFNSLKFDIPLLVEEFLRADIDFDIHKRRHIDIQNIFHKKEKRTLEAAYLFYCDKTLENAHSAEADTLATFEVLEAQLDKYDDLENDVEFLADFSKRGNQIDTAGRIVANEKGDAVFNFGKYKGQVVQDVFKRDPSYYSWMMKGNFTLHTKKVLSDLRLKMAQL